MEKSLSKENNNDKQKEREGLSWTSSENTNFLKVRLGNLECRALFDPGANVSLISTTVAEKFKDRLQPGDSWIRWIESGMGEALQFPGQLKASIVVDDAIDELLCNACEGVIHEMILGMDIIIKWDIEVTKRQAL